MTKTFKNVYLNAVVDFKSKGLRASRENFKKYAKDNDLEAAKLSDAFYLIRNMNNGDALAAEVVNKLDSGVYKTVKQAYKKWKKPSKIDTSWLDRSKTIVMQYLDGGEECVYVFTIDGLVDRIKVGKATGDVVDRIVQQCGKSSAIPGRVILEAVIYCDNCADLESEIHHRLKKNGLHVSDSPSIEWFTTDVKKVVDFVENLNNLISK